MKIVFDSYDLGAMIPVQEYIKNKKFIKYFNRETAAAIVCAGKLLREYSIDRRSPFYYETGLVEFEDLGLDDIATASLDEKGNFSQRLFIEQGIKAVPPLTQFKALYNMPLSFISIEYGFIGDNAVIYASAKGLLMQVLHAPVDYEIFLGCGKVHQDGKVETSFALIDKREICDSQFLEFNGEAIEMFHSWHVGDIPK